VCGVHSSRNLWGQKMRSKIIAFFISLFALLTVICIVLDGLTEG